MEHYIDIYNSKKGGTNGLIQSEGINHPAFSSERIEGVRGVVKKSFITCKGKSKILVYHEQSHSWRGDIYTGYVVEPHQMSELLPKLKKYTKDGIKPFYPMGALTYGSTFSWWENFPFEYQGEWYVLEDFGDFDRHDSLRRVHKLVDSSHSQEACKIKIFQNFDEKVSADELPFFTAYKKSLEKMLLSPGYCSPSRPESRARSSGQLFASMVIIRPCAVKPIWNDNSDYDFQKKHFSNWKYQDIWSYREYGTYENLKEDFVTELANHYMVNYSYSKNAAYQNAEGVVNAMPGRYYSLCESYNKDFFFYKI